jgi:hypothetical protein
LITAIGEDVPREDEFEGCRQALLSALEQRQMRRAKESERHLDHVA